MGLKIALTGYSRAGKDEVASLMVRNSLAYVRSVAFGTALKRELYRLCPHLKDGAKARREMELFGEAMRQIDRGIWIKKLEQSLDKMDWERFPEDIILITDLRQPNEYTWAKSKGYIIVRVVADVEIRRERARTAGDATFNEVNHSERNIELFDCDHVIVNNGTPAQLATEVRQLLNKLGVHPL